MSKSLILLIYSRYTVDNSHIFLTTVDGASVELVGYEGFVGDDICSDHSIANAVGCFGFIGAIRQISAAGATQAGRPAHGEVLSSDLYNKTNHPLLSSASRHSIKLL